MKKSTTALIVIGAIWLGLEATGFIIMLSQGRIERPVEFMTASLMESLPGIAALVIGLRRMGKEKLKILA